MKTNKKSRASISNISKARLAAYAAAGTASAAACASNAEAAIHVFTVNETFDAPPGSYQIGYFNLAGSNRFGLLHERGYYGSLDVSKFGIFGGASAAFNGFSSNGFGYVSKLAAGADIANLPFSPLAVGTLAFGVGYANSQWLDAGQGYIGFKFNTGSGVQYGWASITANGVGAGNSFVLNSYAYGDVGDIVAAGQTSLVPEPGSLALLAAGGVGLLAWRKRRAQAAALTA